MKSPNKIFLTAATALILLLASCGGRTASLSEIASSSPMENSTVEEVKTSEEAQVVSSEEENSPEDSPEADTSEELVWVDYADRKSVV